MRISEDNQRITVSSKKREIRLIANSSKAAFLLNFIVGVEDKENTISVCNYLTLRNGYSKPLLSIQHHEHSFNDLPYLNYFQSLQ